MYEMSLEETVDRAEGLMREISMKVVEFAGVLAEVRRK
jgi:hypothetical protein